MDKKVILITGGSSDIGIELIKNLSKYDTTILAIYNTNIEDLNELVDKGRAKIIPLKCDLSKEEDIVQLISVINERYPGVDAFVHLAASAVSQLRFKGLKWEIYQEEINIQLKSAHLLLSNFLPQMSVKKFGSIVFVLTSYTLNVPPAALSHYVTAKYALLGYMKALTSEYRGRGININAVSPSMVNTKFLKNTPDLVIEASAENNPQKRNANPGDIVPTIEYLLSEKSKFIFGANIPITGGESF